MICTSYADRNDLANCDCPEANSVVTDLALEVASEILYALTGRQYPGTCTATLRPCAAPGPIGAFNWVTWTYPWFPIRVGGNWLNIGPCGCHMANDCACNPYPRVNLGRSDVQSIESVTIDDVVLDSDAYRLDSNRYLTRTDGSGWPCCQDLSKDSGSGTWSIALTYGFPAPTSLVRATAVYATEWVRACIGDSECRLPRRTQNVAKQGVTIELSDPAQYLDDGRTGIPEVDVVIHALNPNGLNRPPVVRSPEKRKAGLWS